MSVGEDGTVVGRGKIFGIGTLLVLKCTSTNRVLMGRKSFRKGFEGSNQFTFPGGMLRSGGYFCFEDCLTETLHSRVLEETGVTAGSIEGLAALDDWPPIIARYTINGNKKVSAAILPFYGEVPVELSTEANDATVHSVGWYDPLSVLDEVTKTNALILTQVLWNEFSMEDQEVIKLKLSAFYADAVTDAAVVGAASPRPAWGL